MKALAVLAFVTIAATSAIAQTPCVRLDMAFSCADGTVLAIHDDPWRGGRGRGIAVSGGGALERGGGDWWRDESYVYGSRGEQCLVHGTHVHCDGRVSDSP